MMLWLVPIVILLGLAAIAILNTITYPRLGPAGSNSTALVSVIIPARNEAGNIGAAVRGLLAQEYPNLEVLVVDDQSEDGTAQVALEAAQGDPRLRLLPGQALPTGWLGKNWACHQAALQARGEVLIFTDADVRWKPGAVAALLAVMEKTGVDLLAVWPWQITQTWGERLVVPMMTFTVLSYLPELAVRKMAQPSLAAATGQCLAFGREAYEKIGGHEGVRGNVLDDMGLAWNIKRAGLRMGQALACGLIETRMYDGWAAVRAGFAKNILAGHGGKPLLLLASAVFHWTLFLLPWLWLAVGLFVPDKPAGWALLPGVALLLALGIRALTAVAAGNRLVDALLLPVSTILMTIIAAQAMLWHRRGGATWKGRGIPNRQ